MFVVDFYFNFFCCLLLKFSFLQKIKNLGGVKLHPLKPKRMCV